MAVITRKQVFQLLVLDYKVDLNKLMESMLLFAGNLLQLMKCFESKMFAGKKN